MGVDMFFVLSGFLISWMLLREYDKYGEIDFINFVRGRFLRLWPALLCCGVGIPVFALTFDPKWWWGIKELFFIGNIPFGP